MAYKFKDPKLARLAAHHKRKTTKRKAEPLGIKKRIAKVRALVFHPQTSPLPTRRKKSTRKKATKKRSAPKSLQHIPAELLHELGYVKKTHKRKAAKKATRRRTSRREIDERIEHEYAMTAPRGRKKATHKKATHKKASKKATRRKTPGGMAHASQMIRTKRLPNLGFAKNYIKRADLTAAEKTKLLKLAHSTYK